MLDHEAAFAVNSQEHRHLYIAGRPNHAATPPTPKPKHRARAVAGTLPDDLYDYIEGEEETGRL
jgi:hypothetical protein